MNKDRLSYRLQVVGDFVPQDAHLLDVGSDHAYLPINLIKRGKIKRALAGEVVEGPYESALNNVKKEGLSDQIEVRLANGLAAFDSQDEVTAISIAGMGGSLIAQILEGGKEKLSGVTKLVLQPNNSENNLRAWLVANDFTIEQEVILEENDKIYEVLVAGHGKSSLSPQEIKFGPYLLQEKSPIFKKKWLKELDKNQKILKNLKENSKDQDKLKIIEGQIKQLEELVR
ncbi:tRNA (adenine(22)-N(1))-methyltransferase TrmK [Streptococcaceae bacterium ESL0729]|nr:tRNA (adenine(22)-N(1))-methyltransferase TrmK [Streptococcaceae bacterium ESL0729]